MLEGLLAFESKANGYDVAMDTPVAETLDGIDTQLLSVLQRDARISWRELGEIVGLSAPAVAERVRRLERANVITGYGANIDPTRIGLTIEAVIRVNVKGAGVEEIASGLPEVTSCDRVTGTDSHIVRAVVRSTSHLEELLQAFWEIDADTITNIVTSRPVVRRPPDVQRLLV